MTDEDGRENVARAMEKAGDLMIVQMEIVVVKMVIARH